MLSPAPPECGEGVPDDAGRDLNVRGGVRLRVTSLQSGGTALSRPDTIAERVHRNRVIRV
jgi:hypothetical protein